MKKIFIIMILSILCISQAVAQEVSITFNGADLKGTLVVPQSDKPVDVVLIIAGSGPTDRDGNNPITGKTNAYKMLADLFLKNGIASLRYDKRGIGASGKVNEANLIFETYIDDAVEWIKFLKNDKRFGRIIVAGHSEGSLLGMVAAKRTNADKYISLNGAGKPIYTVLEEQVIVKSKLPEDLAKEFRTTMDSLKQENKVKKVNPAFLMLFRESIQPYMISWFKYNPCTEIAKLAIPVIIFGGTTDLQVEVEDAQLLAKANTSAKLAVIKDMNHILKEVPTLDRALNLKTYSDGELPLAKELCEKLIEFLKN